MLYDQDIKTIIRHQSITEMASPLDVNLPKLNFDGSPKQKKRNYIKRDTPSAKFKILIYPSATSNFEANLQIAKLTSEILNESLFDCRSYYLLSSTHPKNAVRCALYDNASIVLWLTTSQNHSKPYLNGATFGYTNQRSETLASYLATEFARITNANTAEVPRCAPEPSDAEAWFAAHNGIIAVRANLGYLSNYFDYQAIKANPSITANAVAEATKKFLNNGGANHV